MFYCKEKEMDIQNQFQMNVQKVIINIMVEAELVYEAALHKVVLRITEDIQLDRWEIDIYILV